jgi:chorismate mutase / prephenate dehydratase
MPGDDPTLARLRAEIAAVDDEIVAAVNRRLELVREIRRLKERIGIPFVDRGREDSNLRRLQEANAGPLSSDGLQELYTELLDLTKRNA